MKNSIRSLVLRVGVSLVAIGLILWSQKQHLAESVSVLRHEVSWHLFFAGVATYLVALAVITVRLKYVFRVQEILLSFRETFYLTFVGLFFNLFLPSAVGGDIAKVYYAYKHSRKKIEAMTSVIWDRLMGFATLMIMAIAALWFFSKEIDNQRIDYLVYAFLFIFLSVTVFFLSKRVARRFKFIHNLIPSEKWRAHLADIYHSLYNLKKHKTMLLFTFALSFLGQAFFVLVYFWMTRSLGVEMNPWIFFILVPIVSIVSMAPSLGGLGVREAGIIYLFKNYMPGERALALSLLLDILIYGLSFGSGLLYAFKGGLKSNVIHEMEELDES